MRLTRPRARAGLRRLALFVTTLWLVLTLTWILTRVVGGNPAVKLAGPQPTPETVQGIEVRLGLDRPLGEQYIGYLGNLARGDLGTDYFTGGSVSREVLDRAPGTIQLVAFGALLALLFGVALGVLGAIRRGGPVDHFGRAASVVGLAVPDFVLGLLLSFLLFYRLGLFPAPVGQLPIDVTPPTTITGFYLLDGLLSGRPHVSWASVKQTALPALTLGLVYSAPILRLTRASMLESLHSDSVLYAQACGLRRGLVVRYALRQSMSLLVTYAGVLVAGLLGGAVLVEQVFSWGGLGQFGVEAVTNGNYPAIQAFVLVVGVASLVIYSIVDVVHAKVDPRVGVT
jgi:peptide/nickel transport system permease protein